MKIGIYDPYLDDLGGGEKYMLTLAEVLSQEHKVSIFWDSKKDIESVAERFSLNIKNITLTKNIFSPEISFLKRLLESKKYDAIIILSDGSLPILLSKKIFLHVQQPLFLQETASWKHSIKQKRITKIFYNSEFTRKYNEENFSGIPTSIIYPPVSLSPQAVKKENIILHVGRFRVSNITNGDYKKQQIMVDTFKQMVDKGLKEWQFVVATSIHDINDEVFQQMINSAKGYPISFAINKPNKDLWEFYSKAKIYWHASGFGEDIEKHPEYAEHFGISTVEAMGAGAVPVVINTGGQKEIITNNIDGLLWNTLEDLQTQTKKIIQDNKLWETLSENAKKRSKDFSKEQFAKHIKELLI